MTAYIINATSIAKNDVGNMKVKNTVLQSAFFALANILPIDEAIGYMKKAATKSYSKFGDDVVAQNHKAIELGANAFVKVDVPADWKNAGETPASARISSIS